MYTYLLKEGPRLTFYTTKTRTEIDEYLERWNPKSIVVAWRKGKLPLAEERIIRKNIPTITVGYPHRFIATHNQFLRICKDGGLTASIRAGEWDKSEPYYDLKTEEGAYIYILRGGENCKIGYSSSIRKRISTLTVSCPFQLELLAYRQCLYPVKHNRAKDIEQMIHRELHPHRQASEWFKLTRSQFDVIVHKYKLTVNADYLLDGVDNETGQLQPDPRWLPTQYEIDLELDYQEKLKALNSIYEEKLIRMQQEIEGEPADDGLWIESPDVIKPMNFALKYESKSVLPVPTKAI